MRTISSLATLAVLAAAAVCSPAVADVVPNGERMFKEVPSMGIFAFPATPAYMAVFLDKREPSAIESKPLMLAISLEALRSPPGHAVFAQAPMGPIVAASFAETVPDGRCRVVGYMAFRGTVSPEAVKAAFTRPGSMMGDMAKDIARSSSDPSRYVYRWNIACPASRGQGWDIYDPLGALSEGAPHPSSKDAWVKRAEISGTPGPGAFQSFAFPRLDANAFGAPTPAAAR